MARGFHSRDQANRQNQWRTSSGSGTLWDHLIQDVDASKANHGDVAAHPELIDINFGESDSAFPAAWCAAAALGRIARADCQKSASKTNDAAGKQNLDRLKGIGYVGGASARGNRGFVPDWTHVNSVALQRRA